MPTHGGNEEMGNVQSDPNEGYGQNSFQGNTDSFRGNTVSSPFFLRCLCQCIFAHVHMFVLLHLQTVLTPVCPISVTLSFFTHPFLRALWTVSTTGAAGEVLLKICMPVIRMMLRKTLGASYPNPRASYPNPRASYQPNQWVPSPGNLRRRKKQHQNKTLLRKIKTWPKRYLHISVVHI